MTTSRVQTPPSPTSYAPTRLNRKTSSPISAKHRKDKPRWRIHIPLCAKCGAATGCFCHILNRLRTRFDTRPDDETLFDAIAGLTHEIRKFGLFNFVLSDGVSLFAHASTLLHYIVRQAPFGKARLLDDDVMVDFAEVTTPDDRVAVIATLPLTRDESWSQLAVNELVMFREGKIILNDRPHNPVYMSTEEGLEIARAAGVSV